MPVRDFLRGAGTGGLRSHDNSSQGPPGGKPNQNARKLAAEMARVPVPQIRSSDSNKWASQQQFQQQQQQQQQQRPQLGVQDDQEGDMFDTDVEGVDDTTTITGSMIADSIAIENPRPQRLGEYDLPPLLQQQQQQQHGPIHERFVERVAREYEQQQHPHHLSQQQQQQQFDQNHHDYYEDEHQELQMEDDEQRGEYDDPAVDHLLDWEDTMELDRHPRTWQQIEAALKQGPQQQSNNRNDLYEPENLYYDNIPARRNTVAAEHNVPVPARPATGPAAPSHPGIKPLPRTRLANSRFSTPNPPLVGLAGNVPGLRGTPRPASVAGRPLSPPPSTKPEGVGRDLIAQHEQQQQHQEQQIPPTRPNGGIFDTTNLSAVDNSDTTSDQQTTYTSVRLSTTNSPASASASLSLPSTKRTAPTDTIEADYPPNILHSKTFSDLDAESFDYNPTPLQPVFPPHPQRIPLSLHDKLDRLKSLTEGQRRTFFSSLTLEEWEDSGDWLIGQFGELLERTKEARKERRRMAGVFEREIKRRYEGVEAEGRAIKGRMNEMKTGGLGVLRGQRMN